MKTVLATAVAAVLLTACATAYQSGGFSGGFSEMQMAQDTYRIQFKGNAFTGANETSEMAMLRAAELTLQSGYTHFIVMGAGDTNERSYYVQPGQTNTSLRPNIYGGYDASSTNVGGYVAPIDKPRSEIFIRMVGADQNGLDAQQVYDQLAAKYKSG